MAGYSGGDGSDTEANGIVTISTPQVIVLTTDTGILYDGAAAPIASFAGGADASFLAFINASDTVTIDSQAVFGTSTGLTASFDGTNFDVSNGVNEVEAYLVGAAGGTYVQASDGNFVFTAPCYRRGTGIRTPAGDVAVESLKEGDLVTLADGATAPVVWLGHRTIDCTRPPNPRSVWPILVREGAFAEGVPARDLYLSPGHSVFVEGVLMQAEKLLNGATILQIETDTVEYWHVELESHAILLAENLPAESYLDQGNRTAFINGGDFVEAHPDFQPKHWAETCAKLVFEGPEMQAAKANLLTRAAALGYETTHDDDLHVIADGKRIDLVELGASRVAFILPAGAQAISLKSRTFIPAHVNLLSSDKRTLGIQVRRLQLDGVDIALDDQAALATGWHGPEMRGGKGDNRWTSGETPIPSGTRLIMIERGGRGVFWAERERRQDNVVALFA